jgi:hypothetical protein
MKIRPFISMALLAAGAAAFAPSIAHADIDPGSPFATITPAGSNFQYLYDVDVEQNETLNTGDFFTFFDVNGLVANTEIAPTGWSYMTNLTGPTATGTSSVSTPLTDNPNIENVTFTYTGSTSVDGFQSLGNFGFDSTDPLGTAAEGFSAIAQVTTTPSSTNSNSTYYLGPSGTPAVPEANTAALTGFGAIGLMGLMLRTRKSRSNQA